MKGRIVWVFWLVVMLAVLTATASFAWLAMNSSAGVRGIEIEALTDSLFLEISVDPDAGYDTSVSFNSNVFLNDEISNTDDRLSFITYRKIPSQGALRITTVRLTSGTYNGSGRYFKAVQSDIGGNSNSYVDITHTLSEGESLVGYYTVNRGSWYQVSDTGDYNYYYEEMKPGNTIDYICIGKVPDGERLADRLIWGYAVSDDLGDAQGDNAISVISFDYPPKEYRLHRTVYLRCAEQTVSAKNLKVDSVKIEGRSYLEDTIRSMFVAKSGSGETVTKFYSHRNPENFDGTLFANLMGDRKEVVTVDMYVFFDGSDPDAYGQDSVYTKSDVTVKFAIDDHDYN